MADFIDFVIDGVIKNSMVKEFLTLLQDGTVEELEEWFKKQEYEVDKEDIKRLIDGKASASEVKESVKSGTY